MGAMVTATTVMATTMVRGPLMPNQLPLPMPMLTTAITDMDTVLATTDTATMDTMVTMDTDTTPIPTPTATPPSITMERGLLMPSPPLMLMHTTVIMDTVTDTIMAIMDTMDMVTLDMLTMDTTGTHTLIMATTDTIINLLGYEVKS